jgi:hypothetical protein
MIARLSESNTSDPVLSNLSEKTTKTRNHLYSTPSASAAMHSRFQIGLTEVHGGFKRSRTGKKGMTSISRFSKASTNAQKY